MQPQWIGDSYSSPRAGHFGLYSYCISDINDYDLICQGAWSNFPTILSSPFVIATFFVGFSILLTFICLALYILFLFIRARLVYFICALLQLICALSLLIALLVYPTGFDNDTIRNVCGVHVTSYQLDTCQLRWAYILAMIAFFNVLILALLALFLGMKQPGSEAMREVTNPAHVVAKYGELSETFDDRTLSDKTVPTTTGITEKC